ncbi:MAG TPA: efflux RND transporter periplasmic adaptor subunit [Planctomycetota bacterium]|nr:efflux RND transporter periplasmic adaptor subunit [Planctomycetota bacterium]
MKAVPLAIGGVIYSAVVLGVGVAVFYGDRIQRVVPEEEEHPDFEVAVEVGKVERRTIHRYVEGYGYAEPEPGQKGKPAASARVASSVQGIVAEVFCAEGQLVTKGQPLVRLDDRIARAAEEKAEASLTSAKASLARLKSTPRPAQLELAKLAVEKGRLAVEYTRKKRERQKELLEKQTTSERALSEAALEAAQAANDLASAEKQLSLLQQSPAPQELAEAEAKVTEAERDLTSARATRALSTIDAPLDGTVLRVGVRPGEQVDLTTVLAEIVALDRLVATVGVTGGDARLLKPGMTAHVTAASGSAAADGTLTSVGSDCDAKTDTVAARVALPPGAFRPGTYLRAQIVVEERKDVLAVPKQSIIEDAESGRSFVAVVGDERAMPRSVRVALKEGDWIQVQGKTIEEGMAIVTTGAYALRNDPKGTKIRSISKSATQGPTPSTAQGPTDELTLPVQIGKVTRSTLRRTVEGQGMIEPQPGVAPAGARLASPAPGVVASVACVEGERVEKGQVVIKLDDRAASAAEQKAAAAVESAKAGLARLKAFPRPEQLDVATLAVEKARLALVPAETKLARQQQLASDGVASETAVQDAAFEVAGAKSDVATAEKQLELVKDSPTPEEVAEAEARVAEAVKDLAAARAAHAQLDIAAPLGGTVVRVAVRPGEAVDTTTALAEIVALDRLVASVMLPAGEAALVKPGMKALLIATSDGVSHEGTVSFVGFDVDPRSDSVLVRISVPAGYRPGTSVRAKIVVEEHKDVLAAPDEAVVGTTIFLVDQGKALAKTVKTGLRDGASVEIEGDGLEPDAIVITRGAALLPQNALGSRIRGLADMEGLQKPYPNLKLLQTIPLVGVEGKIDHLCVDPEGKRLFICNAVDAGGVAVIDIAEGRELDRIQNLVEPQAVWAMPGVNKIAVTTGGGAALKFFSPDALKPIGEISPMPDADDVRYDAKAQRLYVGSGKGAIEFIDPAKMQKVAEVKLSAHPEGFELESNGKRIWVNIPNAFMIAVIDRERASLVTTWALGDVQNFPMALDDEHHRLLVGCRTPPKVMMLDCDSGKVIKEVPCGPDMDDLFYDPATKRAFVLCGGAGGSIDVLSHEGPDELARIGRVVTVPNARTGIFVASQQRLYVANKKSEGQEAQVRVYQNVP